MWLLLLACAGAPMDSASTQDSPAPAGVALPEVRWSVAVDLDGIEITEDGSALFEGLDGAEIALDAAWVTLYVLVLEPCEPVAQRPLWSPVPAAYAHGLPDHPSALSASVAVNLLEPGARTLESLAFEPARFCEVGFALLRADGSTQGLPEDGALDDASLSLAGRWRAGGEEWQPLALRSALPVERDVPLDTDSAALTLRLLPAGMMAQAELDGDPGRASLSVLNALAGAAEVQATAPGR